MWRTIIVALALTCLALLGYYAVSKRAVQISARLAASSNAAVAAKVAGVRVEVSERDARLVGTVTSEAERAEAERVVATVSGIKSVKNELGVEAPRPEEPKGPEAPPAVEPVPAPSAAPLALKVSWDGGTVTASGTLPADLKKAVGMVFVTDFPDATVKDTIAAGAGTATPDQTKVFTASVKALARTQSGNVSVDESDLELSGQVGSADEEALLKKLIGDEVKTLGSTVTLTVAQPAVAEDEADAGAEAGADAGEDVAAVEGDTAVAAEPMPAAGALTPAQCQGAIDALIAGDKRITFKGPTGRLSDEAEVTLKAIWDTLVRCPEAKGMIIGFHDDMGEPDKVKELTWRRAFNVHKRLTELGMDKDRFKFTGVGQRDFKYPNKGETRVLNQRVEFKIEVQ